MEDSLRMSINILGDHGVSVLPRCVFLLPNATPSRCPQRNGIPNRCGPISGTCWSFRMWKIHSGQSNREILRSFWWKRCKFSLSQGAWVKKRCGNFGRLKISCRINVSDFMASAFLRCQKKVARWKNVVWWNNPPKPGTWGVADPYA